MIFTNTPHLHSRRGVFVVATLRERYIFYILGAYLHFTIIIACIYALVKRFVQICVKIIL